MAATIYVRSVTCECCTDGTVDPTDPPVPTPCCPNTLSRTLTVTVAGFVSILGSRTYSGSFQIFWEPALQLWHTYNYGDYGIDDGIFFGCIEAADAAAPVDSGGYPIRFAFFCEGLSRAFKFGIFSGGRQEIGGYPGGGFGNCAFYPGSDCLDVIDCNYITGLGGCTMVTASCDPLSVTFSGANGLTVTVTE